MLINMKDRLSGFLKEQNSWDHRLQLPDITLDPEQIKVIMINEVPPENPTDYFYSRTENPGYMETTRALFQNAGIPVNTIEEITGMGIYITTAVKAPKTGYTVAPEQIQEHLPLLEYEIALFPNLNVIMLMGDVAKKAFNLITRKKTKKNVIPSGATYKIRSNKFYYNGIRIFPSYIMTGGNIIIEKSKFSMVSEDIHNMMEYRKEAASNRTLL